MFMFSHDSFMIGEDGPSHQSVEQLSHLRHIPNLNVYRPCNMTELLACYDNALSGSNPSAFVLSKQTLKNQNNNYKDALLGGYVLSGEVGDVEILASGSEVELAMNVKANLDSQDIKTVVASFPCLEIFEKQGEKYKNDVLSRAKIRVSLEASNDSTWEKYIGENGLKISVEKFGKSAKSKDLEKYFNFNFDDVSKLIKNHLKNK